MGLTGLKLDIKLEVNENQQPAEAQSQQPAESAAQSEAPVDFGGNGNGASSVTQTPTLDYENLSLFDDDINMSAGQAINKMNGSSLYQGENVTQEYDSMVNGTNALLGNNQWKVTMDADGDGTIEEVNLADAIAGSFDSVLDLYIEEQVEEIIAEYGFCSKGFLSDEAIKELAMKGIRIDAVDDSNRVYSFSLVDVEDDIRELINSSAKSEADKQRIYDAVYAKDAKIMKDSNGKKGSYIFADCLIPDGYAQGAERNLSSILDMMGKDCISKADFIGRESEYFAMISKVENNISNGTYHELNKGQKAVTMEDAYGVVKDIRQAVNDLWGGHSSAPGQPGKVSGHGHSSDGASEGHEASEELSGGESLHEGSNDKIADTENATSTHSSTSKAADEEATEETQQLNNMTSVMRNDILSFLRKYRNDENTTLSKYEQWRTAEDAQNEIKRIYKTNIKLTEVYDLLYNISAV